MSQKKKKKTKKQHVDYRNYYKGIPISVIDETIRIMNNNAQNGILYLTSRKEIDDNIKAAVSYGEQFNIKVPRIALNGNTEVGYTFYLTLPVRRNPVFIENKHEPLL